jgi:hypothetical protein
MSSCGWYDHQTHVEATKSKAYIIRELLAARMNDDLKNLRLPPTDVRGSSDVLLLLQQHMSCLDAESVTRTPTRPSSNMERSFIRTAGSRLSRKSARRATGNRGGADVGCCLTKQRCRCWLWSEHAVQVLAC